MKKLLLLVTLVILGSTVFSISTNGLISYWNFDTNVGDIAPNDVNSDLNGLILVSNASLIQTGIIGGAYNFNDPSMGVKLPDKNSFRSLNYSVSLWAYPQIFGDSQYLFSNANWNIGTSDSGYYLSKEGDSTVCAAIAYQVGTENYTQLCSTTTVPNGAWSFLVMSYNKDTNALKIYLNSQLIANTSSPIPAFDINSFPAIGVLYKLGGWSTYFHGNIDEVSYWNRELSSADINQLYNNGNALAYPFPNGDLNIISPVANSYFNKVRTIDLNLLDQTGSNLLGVKLAYSKSSGAFTNSIVNDTNLFDGNAFTCLDYNFLDYSKCSFDWNTVGVSDGNYYLDVNFYSTDSAYSMVKSKYIGIDNTKPFTAWNRDSNFWYNSNVSNALTCSDANSGCALTQYRFKLLPNGDFTSWNNYTSPFTILADGKFQIDFNSTDLAGNIGDTNTQFLFQDTNKPIVTSDVNSGWNLTSDANVHLTCSDAISGAASIHYRIDDNNKSDLNWTQWRTFDTNILMNNFVGRDGNFGLQFYCTDNAGLDSNTGSNYDANFVLLERDSPPTPTSLTPTGGNYVSTVTISCITPDWIRPWNYAIDFNTNLLDWNSVYLGASQSYVLDINNFSASTKMWFRCKMVDPDKNGAYLTNATNIVVNPDTGFDSISNVQPSVPTTVFSASLPFSVQASDSSGVSYCTFKIYKNAIYIGDANGINNSGTFVFTDTNVSNGDLVYTQDYCVDLLGNVSSTISSSVYSVNIQTSQPPTGGGSNPTNQPQVYAVDLNFSPPRVDQYWLYAPFDNVTNRSTSTTFTLNQNIQECWTDNKAFTCQIQDGYKIIVSVNYGDDQNFSNLLTTNVFGRNYQNLVGKTSVNFRVFNLAYYVPLRWGIKADSFGAITNNPYLFKIQGTEVVGLRAIVLFAIAITLIMIIAGVMYQSKRGGKT